MALVPALAVAVHSKQMCAPDAQQTAAARVQLSQQPGAEPVQRVFSDSSIVQTLRVARVGRAGARLSHANAAADTAATAVCALVQNALLCRWGDRLSANEGDGP